VTLILIFIQQCFCTDQLYIDDLETLLNDATLSFNLVIQDGSVEEVTIFYFYK
jgi:hypothetical protein